MGQRLLQQSSDNDGECGNTNFQDGNKQNLVNHNNKDNNNKTGVTVKAHITDDNSHAMTNANSSTQQEQLILNFTPDMRHSSLLAIGPQYDFLNTIHEQNARHLASISSQEVFDAKNGKEHSIINNKSCTEKEKNVPSAYLPDHPYQHQTNSDNNTSEQMPQCKGELEREHNTETRQSPVNYASLFGNGDHLLHSNKPDGEPQNVFYYYNNNRTPTIATAESRRTNYTNSDTNKESINTTNNRENCKQSAKLKIENNRTIQPQEKFVEETEQLQNTKVECNANKRVSENDKTVHVLPAITRNTREQMNDSRNSKNQVNSLRTWENVKPKWYKSNIVNRIKKSLSHAESTNVHTANNVKWSKNSKNNNFTVNSHHLSRSNEVMVHKNDNIHINTMSRSKCKNEKEQLSKKDDNTNEYDYSLQTAQKENSMLEYAAQVEIEQEREETHKRLKQIDRIMRGELPDNHDENNPPVKNATFVKEQKNSCNNIVGSNPKTRCIALQSHENELHSNSHVNDKVEINKTAEEVQLQAMMSALFGKNTHKTDKPISLCNNNIDNNKEHKQTSESKQLDTREQQQQQEHEEQSQSSEEESSNKYLSVDDDISCFCSENKKNDVNKQYQPAMSFRTHTSYLLPDLECALLSFAEDDNIYRDNADDHTNKTNNIHNLEFVNNDELKALTCNLQTHKELIDTGINNVYERNELTSPQEKNIESTMPCMPTSPLIVPTTSAAAVTTTTQLSSPEFAKQWSLDNYFDSDTAFKQIENDIRCNKERQNTNAVLQKEKLVTHTEETDHANKSLLQGNKNSSEDITNSDVCTNNNNSNIDKEKEQAMILCSSKLQPHPPPSSPSSKVPRPAIIHTDKNTLTLKSTTQEITKQAEQGNRNTNLETNNVVAVAATRYYANTTRPRRNSNNMETNPLSSFYQSQQTLQEQTNQTEEITTKKEEENQISVGGNAANKLTESDEHQEMLAQTNRKNSNNIFSGGNNNVCKNSANDSLYHSRSKYKIDTNHNTIVETSKTSNDENSISSIFPPPSALRRTRELPVSKWRKISTAFSIIARQARRTNKDYKSNNNKYYIKQEQKQQDDNNINSGNDYFSQTFNFVKDNAKTRMTAQQQNSKTLTKLNINKYIKNTGKTSNDNNDNDDRNNSKIANTNNVNKVNYFESTWFRPHRDDQEAEEEEEHVETQNVQNTNKNVDCDNLESNVNWAAHSMIRKEKMLPGSESSASHEESVSSENISLEKEDAEEEEVEEEVKAMPNFEHYSNDDSDDACSSDINRFNYSHNNRYINTEKLQKSMVNYGSHAWLPKESNTANNKYKNNDTVFDKITGSAGNKSNANYAFSVVTDNLHYDSFNLPRDFNNEEENSTADMNEEFDGHDDQELEMEENETDSSYSDNDNADEYMYSAINHSRLATRGRRSSESSVDSENIESYGNNENEVGVNANGNNNGRPDMAITNRPIPWRTPINTNQNTAPNAVNAPWCNNRPNYLRHHNHRLQNVNNLQLKAGVVQAIRPTVPQAPPPPPHTPFPPTSLARYRQGRYAIPNYAAPNAQVIRQPMLPNNNVMNNNNHIFMCTQTKVNYEAIFNFSLDSVPWICSPSWQELQMREKSEEYQPIQ